MISLEKFTNQFYFNLISWIGNEEALMQFAGPGFTFPLTPEQLDHSLSDPKRFAFAVMNGGDQVGHAEIYLKENSFVLSRILIGNTSWRGKGLCLQIVNELLHFGFTNFDKKFAELNVFDWNEQAIRCYRKAGFSINDKIKPERKIKDKTWIAINMTLSKDKWKTLKS
jgi:RimJ/RimL family protein N-acetyltransferase